MSQDKKKPAAHEAPTLRQRTRAYSMLLAMLNVVGFLVGCISIYQLSLSGPWGWAALVFLLVCMVWFFLAAASSLSVAVFDKEE